MSFVQQLRKVISPSFIDNEQLRQIQENTPKVLAIPFVIPSAILLAVFLLWLVFAKELKPLTAILIFFVIVGMMYLAVYLMFKMAAEQAAAAIGEYLGASSGNAVRKFCQAYKAGDFDTNPIVGMAAGTLANIVGCSGASVDDIGDKYCNAHEDGKLKGWAADLGAKVLGCS